jgi:two-component system CheB/CheR fusion protein
MREQQSRRLTIRRQLLTAIENDEIELVYQPQADLESDALVGLEALVRWQNRDLGAVSPGEFIPIAEESGFVVPLGTWVLREACRQLRNWQEKGLKPVRVAINVSWRQFQRPDFFRVVRDALEDYAVDPSLVELEITESLLMQDRALAQRTLQRLTSLGIDVALDDFGTGYSSLAYLHALPIRSLKIDRSFVNNLNLASTETDASSSIAIVEAICAMAAKLGLIVVAEGIETDAQRSYLKGLGCHLGQGYLISRPLPPSDVEMVLAAKVERVLWAMESAPHAGSQILR